MQADPSSIFELVNEVSKKLSVELEVAPAVGRGEFEWSLRLVDFPSPHGFEILIAEEYLSWWCELRLDDFGQALLGSIERRWPTSSEQFFAFHEIGVSRNRTFNFLVNGDQPQYLPTDAEWRSLQFDSSNGYPALSEKANSLANLLQDSLSLFMTVLADDIEIEEMEPLELGEFEGQAYVVQIRKYERSRLNRAACLRHYGYMCRGCGVELESIYGPAGVGLIHVHHKVPVSQMGGSYRLDPISDLIPLCPNCHNVVHRENPPMTIEALNIATRFEDTES
jgi:5-methylcytosine-specific restriction protein A